MSRKHRGLGRGLDALIPRRTEIEQEFSHIGESSSEVFFTDEPDEQEKTQGLGMERSLIPSGAPEYAEKAETVFVPEEKAELETEILPEEEKEPALQGNQEAGTEKAEEAQETGKEGIKTVRISQIEPNRGQPRRTFDEEALQELADSIKQYGIITPLLVQDRGDHYEIIAGERRWRAAMKAGVSEIPVIVRDDDEKKILEVSLIENIQREDLNPMEEAQAFRELMDKYGLTQEEVSVRVSKSRSAIANSLRLLRLDDRVQQMLKEGKISMGHARALLALDSKEHQFEIAQEIESKQLSVRETEKLVRQLLKKKKERTRTVDEEEKKLQIIYRSLEEQLCQKLGTKVSINAKRNGSGKLQIDFYSYEDLEKMIEKLS